MKGQPIMQSDKSRIIKIARHEMGHYVVARALRFEVGSCSLKVDTRDGHLGKSDITLTIPTGTVADAIDYLERRVQVLYAGAMAQAFEDGDVIQKTTEEILIKDADQDFAKIRELIHVIRNLKFANTPSSEWSHQLAEIKDGLVTKTYDLVKSDAELIVGLGLRLADEVRHYEVEGHLSATVLASIPNVKKRFG